MQSTQAGVPVLLKPEQATDRAGATEMLPVFVGRIHTGQCMRHPRLTVLPDRRESMEGIRQDSPQARSAREAKTRARDTR
jgi:hypothetical protein